MQHNWQWFRPTVGVRQGFLFSPLSPSHIKIFLERIVINAQEDYDGKASIGGGNINNLQLADDIDAVGEDEQELEALVKSLEGTCTRYKMEINAEKTKSMTK